MAWRRVAAVLIATPIVVGGGGFLYLQYKMRNYPTSARRHLRRALLGHHYGGLEYLPGQEYDAAIRETLNAGLSITSPEITGIYEHLADYYNKVGDLSQQRAVLSILFKIVCKPPSDQIESANEKTRRLSIAMKAAQWASEAAESAADMKAARIYLEWIVENSLDLNSTSSDESGLPLDVQQKVVSAGSLKLAPWATPRQIGMTLEQLGHIYSNQNLIDWAVPVYQRALEMLDQDKELSLLERQCRSAILHNNLAECISKWDSNKEALTQALQLATISMQILEKVGPLGTCGECDPITYFNMGAILDKLGQSHEAVSYFKQALARSQHIGFSQGVEKAQRALNKPT
ncbi:hypothetical protein BDEG_23635 [Batrachochytrium dendrobatidis JEL423]|nr:hypothetical protein BDEG_23635 [Batrachochytrium dendrobatidis JEL423]